MPFLGFSIKSNITINTEKEIKNFVSLLDNSYIPELKNQLTQCTKYITSGGLNYKGLEFVLSESIIEFVNKMKKLLVFLNNKISIFNKIPNQQQRAIEFDNLNKKII